MHYELHLAPVLLIKYESLSWVSLLGTSYCSLKLRADWSVCFLRSTLEVALYQRIVGYQIFDLIWKSKLSPPGALLANSYVWWTTMAGSFLWESKTMCPLATSPWDTRQSYVDCRSIFHTHLSHQLLQQVQQTVSHHRITRGPMSIQS